MNSPAKPRFLVWGVCIGDRGRRLLDPWLGALLRVGKWRHDIVVLADESLPLSHEQLLVINLASDIEKKYSLPRQEWTDRTCHNLKPQIQFYVDLLEYDYALYLDLDVLVNTCRLEALLESKRSKNKICPQRGRIPISSDKPKQGGKLLTSSEKARWADHSICAGIVGFPTTNVGLELIADWHAVNLGSGFHSDDQGNLVSLLLRKYLKNWEYMGDTVFGRKLARYDETLVHFSARRDELLQTYFHSLLSVPLRESTC